MQCKGAAALAAQVLPRGESPSQSLDSCPTPFCRRHNACNATCLTRIDPVTCGRCYPCSFLPLPCLQTRGGLRDKPGKAPDYYHTCYCLSGLSSSQHYSGITLGGPGNRLRQADPLCNVVEDKVAAAIAFFS